MPGEDPAQFHARVDGYKNDLRPRGTVENDLVEQMAQQAWQIDRALAADAARVTISIQTAAAEGERRRRYKNGCERDFHRTIATWLKVRKEVDIPDLDDRLVPEPQLEADSQRVREHPAEEVHDLRNETIGADFNDEEGDAAGVARDPAHVADEAYPDALESVQ